MIFLLGAMTFVLSVGAVRGFLEVSKRRLVDHPTARSSHSRPTPTGGGFPVIVVFLIASGAALALHVVSRPSLWGPAALCVGLLGLVGLLDDLFDLPRSARYAVHLLVAATVVCWIGHPGPHAGWLGVAAFAAWVVFFTGLVNAVNFMDGIDAIVGGTGVVILSFFAWFTQEPLWILAGASYAGFLVFNVPPARLFMGDAGSTALGGLVSIAVLSEGTALNPCHLVVLVPLIGDSAYTIFRRLLRRENIFRAHHSHIYQRLLRADCSHGAISGGYIGATIALGMLAVSGSQIAGAFGVVTWMMAVVTLETFIATRRVPFTRA